MGSKGSHKRVLSPNTELTLIYFRICLIPEYIGILENFKSTYLGSRATSTKNAHAPHKRSKSTMLKNLTLEPSFLPK